MTSTGAFQPKAFYDSMIVPYVKRSVLLSSDGKKEEKSRWKSRRNLSNHKGSETLQYIMLGIL